MAESTYEPVGKVAAYEVVGAFPIVDVDGSSVPRGGTVSLDDGVTNIPALVEAGLVMPKTAAAKKASATQPTAASSSE